MLRTFIPHNDNVSSSSSSSSRTAKGRF